MILSLYQDPYEGLAASIVTSNLIDTRDAFDLTMSVRTVSGTSSVFSYEISNSSVAPTAITDATFSHYTIFGLVSTKTLISPPLGARWARVVRTVSGGSYVIEMNKLVR